MTTEEQIEELEENVHRFELAIASIKDAWSVLNTVPYNRKWIDRIFEVEEELRGKKDELYDKINELQTEEKR